MEPAVAEQLIQLWNKSPMTVMPGGVPPQPTRNLSGMQAFVPAGHYLPAEYATAPYQRPPRLPQYPSWGTRVGPGQGFNPHPQRGMIGAPPHRYPLSPQDFAAAQHFQSQYGGYPVPQQMSKNYPYHQPSSTNSSVMILQRGGYDSAPTAK